MKKQLNVGLFGFGCVGQGLYDVLQQSQNFTADIKKIVVKHKDKPRKIGMENFAFDKNELLHRNDLNVIVELIDNSEEALEIVLEAMQKNWDVVTANKKLIAENFELLYQTASRQNVALLYEGAVAGGIPILRNLEEYYDNELLSRISGIINGSSNYMLTKMETEKIAYPDVVKKAQTLGFAEIDPWLDVAGYDAKFKLTLLIIHAFGLILKPESILNLGINNISTFDIQYASEKGKRIKLVATAFKSGDKLKAYVLPHFVSSENPFYFIHDENNAVEVEGAFSDKQLFTGKGAGSYPTGSAVLSDISALSYHYRYAFKKLKKSESLSADQQKLILDVAFNLPFYIRYTHENDLKSLEILEVFEQYSSPQTKYIVAKVGIKSLYNLMNKSNKLFVCVM